MDIKVLSSKDNVLKVLITNSDPVFVNTLRRVMMTEVPTLAVKNVTFVKNTSALFDENLAHRLGLIPLVTDDSYVLPDKCTCEKKGCAKCQSTLTLNCEGPLTVYAQDLKFQDPKVKSIYGKIPLVKLLKGQELEFEAVITLGRGIEHAKYSPGLVYYRGYPSFEIGKKTLVKDCIANCDGLLKQNGEKLEVTDFDKWNDHYEQVCENSEIKIINSDSDFIMTIEAFGKMTSMQMLEKSLDVIDEKLDELHAEAK